MNKLPKTCKIIFGFNQIERIQTNIRRSKQIKKKANNQTCLIPQEMTKNENRSIIAYSLDLGARKVKIVFGELNTIKFIYSLYSSI